jgi:hypothetical protein
VIVSASGTASFIASSIVIGCGATAIFDLWKVFMSEVMGAPRANWVLGGRWFGYLTRFQFHHQNIGATPPFPAERLLGWVGHYVVGIVYAAALLGIWGMGWASAPTVWPALVVGAVTVLAGWFMMAPGMGAGIANANTPTPAKACALQLASHVVFGLGLYVTALGWAAL